MMPSNGWVRYFLSGTRAGSLWGQSTSTPRFAIVSGCTKCAFCTNSTKTSRSTMALCMAISSTTLTSSPSGLHKEEDWFAHGKLINARTSFFP